MNKVISILFGVLLCSNSIFSQWSTNPAVNTFVAAYGTDLYFDKIISDGNGGYFISFGDGNAGGDVYVQKFNANGVAQWTSGGILVCTGRGNVSNIISDGNGGAILSWADQVHFVYAQRINSSGVKQWGAFGVAVATSSISPQNIQLETDGSNGVIIAWTDIRNSNYDIFAQRVNSTGVCQWTTDGVGIAVLPFHQANPHLIKDDFGGAIIVWDDGRSGTGMDIYAQRINSAGVCQWIANGISICNITGGGYSGYSNIVSDGSGGAFITWRDQRAGRCCPATDVYAQRVNASGVAQWTLNGILVGQPVSRTDTWMLSDGNGGAIITWTDGGIKAQLLNSAGVAQWGSGGLTVSSGLGGGEFPEICTDGNGGAIITWQDSRSGNSDIYAQKINSSGLIQWIANGVTIANGALEQINSESIGSLNIPNINIVSDGSSGAVITFLNNLSGRYDVFVQNVLSDGRIGAYLPTVTTSVVTNITSTTASGGGNVTFFGGSLVTNRGIVFGASPNPDITPGSLTLSSGTGAGSYSVPITGLNSASIYYVKAFATNSIGTSYGNQVSFTLPQSGKYFPLFPPWLMYLLVCSIISYISFYLIKKGS
ncbi:MAG: hypothetical protein NT007_04170 [Candidatus Kapabacteria bacterium]|nr:hypothetical protein [Candidatus Kapabacteria bacterium]